ncbi:MarR family transcriptional regulator [Agrobacterium sp. SORGH_AS 787]|uniref:MarR family winged helix-turn-helix transcriptional regulator n=1 Tax=Agrobacterium sp. SORGH_AS 787 TaxID=3041775 RepID=UPI00277F9A25|nr:DNA-binding MarR family transcriptional regulator [Rhizobium sp. SORGH_AS_0787]
MTDAHETRTGELIFEILRLHGRLIAAGDALVGPLGLTSARWQVLGTVANAQDRITMADIARSLGQSRQSVRRIVNELLDAGFVEMADNPRHQRAPHIILTSRGTETYAEATAVRIPWNRRLSTKVAPQDVDTALAVMRSIRAEL